MIQIAACLCSKHKGPWPPLVLLGSCPTKVIMMLCQAFPLMIAQFSCESWCIFGWKIALVFSLVITLCSVQKLSEKDYFIWRENWWQHCDTLARGDPAPLSIYPCAVYIYGYQILAYPKTWTIMNEKKNHFTGHLPLYPTCKVSQGALFWNLISKQILAHLAIIVEPVYWDHENLNPLCAKFVRGNIIMYLHFMSFLHIDMRQVVEIQPHGKQGSAYCT